MQNDRIDARRDDEIDLIELVRGLWAQKGLILGVLFWLLLARVFMRFSVSLSMKPSFYHAAYSEWYS